LTAIPIKENKRNKRKQEQHLQFARGLLSILKEMGEATPGRPSEQKTVEEYRKKYPNATKAECIKETKLSKPTVYKWWNIREGAQE
jgi:hypothetical protein